MKLTRQEVFAIIHVEREYQDSLTIAKRTPEQGPPTQAEFFTMIDVYLSKAREEWTFNQGSYVSSAQAAVRKIAALCVRSMEIHGAPARKLPLAISPMPETKATEAFYSKIIEDLNHD